MKPYVIGTLVVLTTIMAWHSEADTPADQAQQLSEQSHRGGWVSPSDPWAPRPSEISPAQDGAYRRGYSLGDGFEPGYGTTPESAQGGDYPPGQSYQPWQAYPPVQGYGAYAGYEPGWGYGATQTWPAGTVRLSLVDQNHDGVISDDEAAVRQEEAFIRRDKDGDGVLVPQEYINFRAGDSAAWGVDASWRQAQQSRKERWFREMDVNGDARVDKVEFMAAAQRRYEAADLDSDGKVSVWEFRSQRNRN